MDAERAEMRRAWSQALMEYETLKYFPTLPGGTSGQTSKHPDTGIQPKSSSDATLTALVQLAACQTGAARSFVFVFSATHDHAVAEAVPAPAVSPGFATAGHEDHLWLCGRAFARQPENEPSLFAHLPKVDAASSDDASTSHPLLLIPNLDNDSRLTSSPFSVPDHHARSYASVPIRTRRGIHIGMLCVINPTEQLQWDSNKTDTLRDISRTLMSYLETRRTAAGYRRSIRMNSGISSFSEGEGSLSGWQNGANTSAFANIRNQEGQLNESQQTAQHTARIRGYGTSTTSSEQETTQNLPSHSNVFSRASNLIREATEIEGCLFVDAQPRAVAALNSHSNNSHTQSQSGALNPSTGDIDASVGQANSSDSTRTGSGSSSGSDGARFSIAQSCKILGYSTSDIASINGIGASAPEHTQLGLHEKLLSKLLRRYPTGKIFNFDASGELDLSDSSGDDPAPAVSPTVVVQAEGTPHTAETHGSRRPWARRHEAESILKAFPGARSVAFVPLRDQKQDRWHAGAFAYTHHPWRTFTQGEELTYLRAFGTLAMSERQRLEILGANKAKDDVLNSISHELRSPLHGIVLGVELLQETNLNVFQGGLLHSVETCGRTLMDTIDHLLDFTKINNYSKIANRRVRNSSQPASPSSRPAKLEGDSYDLQATSVDINLDALTEEVIESVFAGHTYQSSTGTHPAREGGYLISSTSRDQRQELDRPPDHLLSRGPSTGESDLGRVTVSLSMDSKMDWRFLTQPGAIRRLVMNLFANALKYTKEGSIRVELSQRESDRKSRSGYRTVVLTITDTGRGISEDFLRNNLYRPFSQETTLSSGAGLGLSIVKQVASSLGGKVRIESTLGHGTTASVTIPMMPTPQTTIPSGRLHHSESMGDDKIFADRVKELQGLRVRLLGFATAAPAADRERQTSKIVEDICGAWLRMTIVSTEDIQNGTCPDVILATEEAMPWPTEHSSPPCVVVCSNAFEAYKLATSSILRASSGVYEFVSQPLGPRKVAKILIVAYTRWHGLRKDGPLPLPSPSLEAATAVEHASEERENNSVEEQRKSSSTSRPADPATVGATPHEEPQQKSDRGAGSPDSKSYIKTANSKFLLVDDNPINLKILATIMNRLGQAYSTATNGREAIDAYQAAPGSYSCIFMDISMPVMDGFEATRLIRTFERDSSLERTFILALSGLASESAQQQAYGSGINMFMAKPVRQKDLKEVLASQKLLQNSTDQD